MYRGRLKNIINKSIVTKLVSKEPYDLFVESLPSELDYYKDGGKYRLKAAWEAYGKPKDYKEALWQGLVETIGGNFKMPSIGYNEETEEYEYLNTGKENETVAKDIRAWDNDVIPFIKELKLGGYIRKFNEEKNCWTYSKTPMEKEEPAEIVETFQKGGKPRKIKSDLSYYDPDTDTIYYSGSDRKSRKEAKKHEYVHARPGEYNELFEYLRPYYENLNDDRITELGGDLEFVKRNNGDPNHYYSPEELVARVIAAQYRTRNVPDYSPEFFAELRNNEIKYGDNMRDLLHMYNDENLSKMFKYFNKGTGGGWAGGFSPDGTFVDPNGEIGDGLPLRPTGEYSEDGQEFYINENGQYFTLQPQFKQGGKTLEEKLDIKREWVKIENSPGHIKLDKSKLDLELLSGKKPVGELANQKLYLIDDKVYFESDIPKYKQGGQMNVIPEGALHARKNHMELAKEGGVTHKGIPVVDEDGNQQAEVEKEEWTMTKELTDTIEKWYHEYYNEDISKKEKDELAIKCGKRICKELLHNTDDRVGIIEKLLEEF